MRSLALVLAAGCTSTHPLTDLGDLRSPERAAGFVIHHERVDPNTVLRFGDAHGRWSRGISGSQLHVDGAGVWTDTFVHPWEAADAVRIDGMPEIAAARIEPVRPVGALLERDGEAYVLSAPRPTLERWLLELELAVARLEPEETVTIPGPQNTTKLLDGDEAKLYQLRNQERGATLGTWSFSAKGGPWQAPIHGTALVDFIDVGRRLRVGWKWSDIARADVENIDGGKTFVGLVLVSAASISLAGLGVLAQSYPFGPHQAPAPAVPAGGHATPDASWKPDLAPVESAAAPSLFSTGAKVRAVIRPVVTLDAATTLHRDLTSSGVSARIRLMDVFEIGGGARETLANGRRQTTGMFQTGLHLPLDAGFHYAIPLGFEVGGGGDVAIEVRVPWGLRFSTGRWLASLLPATPEYLHLRDQPRRWSLASGVELGATF